jgi:autotransporter-associated beta strand protein
MGHSARQWAPAVYLALAVFGLSVPSARAVIIAGGDGTGNAAAPADSSGDPGWANVGTWTLGTNGGVYLGDGWVLTASHVYRTDHQITFGGVAYQHDGAGYHQLHYSAFPYQGQPSDLVMFKILAPPALPTLTINSSSNSVLNNATVRAIGSGRNRQAGMTYWDASWNEVPEGQETYSGFKYSTSGPAYSKRWGDNRLVSSSAVPLQYSLYQGGPTLTTAALQTSFDNPGVGNNEFQAAEGDSGGGVFYKRSSGNWELLGVMLTVTGVGTPDHYAQFGFDRAVFGDTTYFADLRQYRTEINALMADKVWNGLGTNSNWSTALNWGGAAPTTHSPLVFSGPTRLNNTNDFAANTLFARLTFNATAGAFTLNGNAINLPGTVLNESPSPNAQTINLNLNLLAGGGTFDAAAGAGNVTVNGVISGAGVALTKNGPNTLILTNANTYSGGTTINAGTLQVGTGGATGSIAGNVTNNGTLAVNRTGTLALGNITGTGTTTLTVSGLTVTANHVRQNALDVAAGATMKINANAGPGNKAAGVSVLTSAAASPNNALRLAANGVLDVTNNDLVVYYPSGTGATALANLQQYVYNAYQGTAGVPQVKFDTSIVVGSSTYQTYLAAFDNGALATPWTAWAGQALSGTNQIVAKYTFRGDVDLNGVVDGNDFTVIQQNFGAGSSVPLAPLDAGLLASLTGGSGNVAVVPEPSTLALAILAALGAVCVWRRRRSVG